MDFFPRCMNRCMDFFPKCMNRCMNSAWIFFPRFSTGLSRFEIGHRGEKIHAPFMHLLMHLGKKIHAPIHAPSHARGKNCKFENSCTFSCADPTPKLENHSPEFIQDSLRAIARATEWPSTTQARHNFDACAISGRNPQSYKREPTGWTNRTG